MYSPEERNAYFEKTIDALKTLDSVEGVVQIGSGVEGYKDEYSDIDLMVATGRVEDAEYTKERVHQVLSEFHPAYIKEKKFTKDIFLLIVILDNQLEFNISIVPREMLSVRSPLWKVIVDKTGLVSEKMNKENEAFLNRTLKYNVGFDLPFEFVYCARSLEKELNRNNLIYALRMLEEMREFTLIVQALNEDKKLHQFKAYETLNPSFIQTCLSTYPEKITVEGVRDSSHQLMKLFAKALEESSIFSMDEDLKKLLDTVLKEREQV
ncbi:aminoglycoside 6-adenylyltransferase [Bacillus salacetis]|uniref:aminoglycoside 6-adenylyltransferase n=1 Tax=Bacillus salacetis TaxID=2315464 RepID=UPI003B9E18CB